MSDHHPNHSEFRQVATMVHSCFHPDGAYTGMSGDCGPCEHIVLTRSIRTAGTHRNFHPLPVSDFSHSLYPFRGFASLSQINNGLPIINILSHDWVQNGYQCPIPSARDGLEYLGFHSYSECGQVRGFEDTGVDCLCHSPTLKNILYLLYRFPESHMPREVPFIGPSLPAG